MPAGTITATAVAAGNTDPEALAREAAENAASQLNGRVATYGFVFCAPSLPLAAVLAAVEKTSGCPQVIGCHTAGEFNERGLVHGGVAVMLVASANDLSALALASAVKANPRLAARQICAPATELAIKAKPKGYAYGVSVCLVDGLNGAGDELVTRMVDALPPSHRIVGGAAGDEGAFKATPVGARREAVNDGAAFLHVSAAKRWGVGVGHGLKPTTQKMQVTKADKNVIYQIDGRPAFETYRAHAQKRGITLQPESAGEYMIGNELGIYFFNDLCKARAPLSVGSDGSLSCAAEVPQGSTVCILDGEPASMLTAVRHAAEEAKAGLGEEKAAGVLIFDCICRGMILKERFQEEIGAVRAVFGEVPVAGFLTYGEIARYKGSYDGWHNTTAVVVAIPA